MEIISSSHVDVEEKILNPYGWVSCPIVLLYVYGFKPFRELMLHYFVCETQRMGSASYSSYFTLVIGVCPSLVSFPALIVMVEPRLVPSLSVR